jgi:cytidylate kinase
MPAVGKSVLAKSIADWYDLKNISAGEILKQIARDNGYNINDTNWWETKSGFAFCNERIGNPNFDMLLDKRLHKIIEEDNVVSTARAMPWLFQSGSTKIWLDATQETRAKRMCERDKIQLKDAMDLIKRRDANDKLTLFRLYGIKLGADFSPFDLVVDTEELSIEKVKVIVAKFLRKKMADFSQFC